MAEIKFETFYLGNYYEQKIVIIKDFLSEEGKLYNIRPGTIFVKDTPEVLKTIDEFIKENSISKVPQIRVSLRNNSQSKSTESQFGISGRVDNNGVEIGVKAGQDEHIGQTELIQSVLSLSGSSAEISLLMSQDELNVYRNRYLTVIERENVRDGFILKVTPVKVGDLVRVQIVSIYWDLKRGKRRLHETGEINTIVMTRPNQWLKIGGGMKESQDKENVNIILSRNHTNKQYRFDYSLKTELVKIP